MRRLKYIFQKTLFLVLLPTLTACQNGEWSVGNADASTAYNLIHEYHEAIQPFVIALATAGVAYNAITIIVTPTGRWTSDEAITIARRRIITIICAVIAFFLIEGLFAGGFVI